MALKRKQIKSFEVHNEGNVGQLRIIGEIRWWSTSGERFIRLVDELLEAGVEDAFVYINSPGGDLLEANEIANELKRFPGTVRFLLGSICASAATGIPSPFKRENIKASSNTMLMIHDPWWKPLIEHEEDFESSQKLYTNLRNGLIRGYHKLTEISEEEISQMMRKTTWMDAEEAKGFGFVGGVEGDDDSLMPEDTAKVLSKYKVAVPELLNTALRQAKDTPSGSPSLPLEKRGRTQRTGRS